MKASEMKCQKCGKNVFQCTGFLKRVNETGVPGIFQCSPDCDTVMTSDEAVIAAVEGG